MRRRFSSIDARATWTDFDRNWAGASTYFIGMAIGIDLIFDGGALLGFAAAIHSLPKIAARTA